MASKILTRVVLPLVLVGAGIAGARMMSRLAPEVSRATPETHATLVEVVTVKTTEAAARIVSSGVVEPGARLTVVPEVSGRVVRMSKHLVPGGRIAKGELVIQLDPREYQLALKQQTGQLKSVELQLEQELGRQSVARREWELLGKDQEGAQKALVLREPHLAAAKEQIETVNTGIDRAKLNVARTTIVAPFNASVASENIEVGQVVGPGQPVATLIGADRFWVRSSIPVEQLDQLDIPGVAQGEDAETGSKARIIQELAGDKRVERDGRVLRLETQMDTQTRTAVVIIGVDDPLDPPEGGLPLLPGAFVRIEIAGKSRTGVTVLPTRALHEGDRVWIVDAESRLAPRQVTVAYSMNEEVHVTAGLKDGDRVVVSPLALPIEGMLVKVAQTKAPTAAPSASDARAAAPPPEKAP